MRMLGRQAARRSRPQFPQSCPFHGWGRGRKIAIFAGAPPLPSAAPGIETSPLHVRKSQFVWKGGPHNPRHNAHEGSTVTERPPQLHDAAAPPAGPSPQLGQAAAVQLMRRIKAARSWQQLQVIVDENLPLMNHLHVSAAVTHMAQLHASSSGCSSSNGTSNESDRGHRRLTSDASLNDSQLDVFWERLSNANAHLNRQSHVPAHRPPPGPGRQLVPPEVPEHLQVEPSLQLAVHAPAYAVDDRLRRSSSLLQVQAGHLRPSLPMPQTAHQQHHRDHQLQEPLRPATDLRTSFLQRLEHAVATHLPSFEGRQLANTLWAVAKLGHRPSEHWLELLLTRASVQMHTFDPQHLANTLYALMLLRYMPPAAWLEDFYAAASRRIHDFGPAELSHLCYAAGKLGLQPGRELLGGVLHHSMMHMEAYGIRELALLLYGVVHMGARLHADWLRVYRRRVLELVIASGALPSRLLRRLAEQLIQPEVARLAREQLAQLQSQQQEQEPQLCSTQHSSTQRQQQKEEQHVPHLWRARGPTQQHGVDSDRSGVHSGPTSSSTGRVLSYEMSGVALYLPTVLCSLAELGHRPPPLFMSTVLAAVGGCAGQFTTVGLTTVLVSLANMRYRPHPALFRRVWTLLMDSMGSLDTRQCTIAVWACATLGCTVRRGDVAAVVLNAAARLPEHSDGEVLQLLEAVAALGFEPTCSWLELLESDLYNRLPRMRPHEVAALLLPLARVGHKPHRLWMARWAETLLAGLSRLGLRHLSAAMYGAARLGFRPPLRLREELLAAAAAAMAAAVNGAALPAPAATAAAESEVQQDPKPRRVRPTWERRKGDRAGGARLSETLSRLLWGLAVLDIRPGASWLSGYMACLQLVREGRTEQERSQLVWALARLQYEPGPEWGEELALWHAQQRQPMPPSVAGPGVFSQTVSVPASAGPAEARGAAIPHAVAAAASRSGIASDDAFTVLVGAAANGVAQHSDDAAEQRVQSAHSESNVATRTHGVGGSNSDSDKRNSSVDVDALVLQGIQEWAARKLGDPAPAVRSRRRQAVGPGR